MDVSATKDRQYISINITSRSCSEVRVLPTTDVDKPLRLIQQRQPRLEYFLDHHQDHFYLVTNAFDPERMDFSLAMVSSKDVDGGDTSMKRWQLLPLGYHGIADGRETNSAQDGQYLLEDVDLFESHAVVYMRDRKYGLQKVFCRRWSDGLCTQVPLPAGVGIITPGLNRDWNADRFRFIWHGLGDREKVLEYPLQLDDDRNIERHTVAQRHVIRHVRIPGVDWEQDIQSNRILVPSADGKTRIPVTLVYRKQVAPYLKRLLENHDALFTHHDHQPPTPPLLDIPILMTGYAAYGIAADPLFDISYIPLLQRNWILATVHARGGSELGRSWYAQGRHLHKKNSALDFIAAAVAFRKDILLPVWLCATGLSAGGMMVADALRLGWHRQAPLDDTSPKTDKSRTVWQSNLFRAAILHVPFVDPLTAMLDPTLPLTTTEYEEWGNPRESKKDYEYLSSYAPYDNVPTFDDILPPGYKYSNGGQILLSENGLSNHHILPPSLFITTGELDTRVAYWQPLKYVARLRQRLAPWYGLDRREHIMDRQKGTNDRASLSLLLREEGGHFDDSSESTLEEAAFRVSFLLQEVERGRNALKKSSIS